jgi:hypothetical protein
MKSAYNDFNLMVADNQGQTSILPEFPSFPLPSSLLSYQSGAKRRVGGLGGVGRDAPSPPLSLLVGETFAESGEYSAYVPSIETTLIETLISGLGSKTSDSCGESIYKTIVHCSKDPEHDRYQVGGSSCGDPSCPVCWTQWAHRGADRISCRVDGFRQFARVPPRHIILSLDPVLYDFDAIGKMGQKVGIEFLKSEFRKLADLYGVTGGALIVHLYRTTDEVPRNIPSVKKWQWVRDQGPGRFHELTVFQPHAHLAVYGYLIEPKKGEFLYKNKGALRTRDDIERWAYYSLSHASIIEGKQAVTYFGDCSNRKLKHTWSNQCSLPGRCEVCGAVMIYEGTNEVFFIKRTFADWIYSSTGFDKTLNPLDPSLRGGNNET